MVVAASESMGILRLRICSAAFAAALTLGAAAGPPVKKSEAGICHVVTSPYYQRTQRFVPYNSMAECIASGGHAPKRGFHEPERIDPWSPALHWIKENVLGLGVVAGLALILYPALQHAIQRWRNSKREREFAERERARWKGHRRETPPPKPVQSEETPPLKPLAVQPDDDAVFKQRRHRRDPWLKVLGYFKR